MQGKPTITLGLKKSTHKTVLKDGEYTHLKNGFVSSIEGDIPFLQNAPSNMKCLSLKKGFSYLGDILIKERDHHILFLYSSKENTSEIGIFYPKTCTYTTLINNSCLNFSASTPIKGVYQIINCELHIYFQDGNNKDRHINLDKPQTIKQLIDGECVQDSNILDCSAINIQNDLMPPVVKPLMPLEAGALFSGVYQFALAYSNINGDEQSSYYSKTNPLPIYKDGYVAWDNIEGSASNILTTKAIPVEFSNLDTRYEYFNLAVIKTIQGTPTYEVIATLPISTKNYLYTGREITKLLSIDKLMGLYPDYYNSKTITSANNYLIRGNMSTQDEINYQPIANLIELEWVCVRKKADTFETTYKNPLMSVYFKGYQRGEVYPFGIQFLLSNGKKSSVFHIPGRNPLPEELFEYTPSNIPEEQSCNFFELNSTGECNNNNQTKIKHWEVYDTATITDRVDEENLDPCFDGVVVKGEFAYWESTDTYPCNSKVWGSLAGKPIRHHKFPTNNTFHHHNQPYDNQKKPTVDSNPELFYEMENVYIYPMGVQLKFDLDFYLKQSIEKNFITEEEANLIVGYEIVRGDRTGNKSVIAKGLFYNMQYYSDKNPANNNLLQIMYPNYPFNDLSKDPYLNQTKGIAEDDIKVYIEGTDNPGYSSSSNINMGTLGNPYSTVFVIPETIEAGKKLTIYYTSYIDGISGLPISYGMQVYIDEGEEPTELFAITNEFPKENTSLPLNYDNIFTFNSPDTSFKNPFIGTNVEFHSIEFGLAKGRFDLVEGHPRLKPAKRSDSTNYALAYKGIGDYNTYSPIKINNLRRRISDSGYLLGGNITKLPNTKNTINNRFRESSVGIRLNCNIDPPKWELLNPHLSNGITDGSRYILSNSGLCSSCTYIIDDRGGQKKDTKTIDSQCTEAYKWISAYYGSLKTKIPNQYGQIDTIKYVLTGQYHQSTDIPVPIFGGDTFITRFSLKRKNAFYRVNFINQSPVGITYKGSKYANLLTPKYYLVNEKGGFAGLNEYVVEKNASQLDCSSEKAKNKNGFFYLFSTGIQHFFVESEINTELRYSGENLQDTFYPKLKNTNVWDWMEETKVPIIHDNSYLYNFDYSKPNTEEALFTQAPDFVPNSKCKNTHPRRIVYSKQNPQESTTDNWLVFPGNNYYDIDSYMGSIIDLEALDTYRIICRCENGSMIFNAYDTLQLEETSVSVGTGGMFSERPKTFAETDTGYAGSQNKYAFNNTKHGCFFLDEKRTAVFNYSSQLEEISTNGLKEWFNENIPFNIKKQFPQINTDNPYNGVGFSSGFDDRFDLWFLTKKDYILKDLTYLKDFKYDNNNNLTLNYKLVDFSDEKMWEEVSWTVSYSPLYKAWISFHSFFPNYYIDYIKKFFTSDSSQILYEHWDKFSFQKYYDKLTPFEVTITTGQEQEVNILQSIEYNLKVQKYLNGNYQDLYENHDINFNKSIISTDNQSSGLLNLIKKDNQNPFQSLEYPKINTNSLDILYSKVEGHQYRINQFADLVLDKTNNISIFDHSKNGVDKVPNNIQYEKINNLILENQKFRNEFFDITLINDKESEYKFILKLLLNKTLKSFR